MAKQTRPVKPARLPADNIEWREAIFRSSHLQQLDDDQKTLKLSLGCLYRLVTENLRVTLTHLQELKSRTPLTPQDKANQFALELERAELAAAEQLLVSLVTGEQHPIYRFVKATLSRAGSRQTANSTEQSIRAMCAAYLDVAQAVHQITQRKASERASALIKDAGMLHRSPAQIRSYSAHGYGKMVGDAGYKGSLAHLKQYPADQLDEAFKGSVARIYGPTAIRQIFLSK